MMKQAIMCVCVCVPRVGGVTDDVIPRGTGFEVHGVQVRHDDLVSLQLQLLQRHVSSRRVERSRTLVGVNDQSCLLS